MFEDWKQAWRQAVANFQREAAGGTGALHVRAMERELASAGGALVRLDQEIRRTQRDLENERTAEQVCRRREVLARDAGDDETVRIATEFAVRHAERAALLERKVAVLADERALLGREVDAMRDMLAQVAPAVAGAAQGAVGSDAGTQPQEREERDDREFSRMAREARERAADERLEELKRKLRG